jgi:hypothetical protein
VVYRVGLPRTDLGVLEGSRSTALALGSWLAFQKIGDQAMVMGDLVLTAEESTRDEKAVEAASTLRLFTTTCCGRLRNAVCMFAATAIL